MHIQITYDETHDCYLLPISDTLLKELNWEVGDTLFWCYKDNQTFLRKFKNSDEE